MAVVRQSGPTELDKLASKFKDSRLKNMLPLYKARNYPRSLSSKETEAWEKFCNDKLFSGEKSSRLASYFSRLDELAQGNVSNSQKYLLEELLLYGQSIAPLAEESN
jgi:exodeoxyribonuclease-1